MARHFNYCLFAALSPHERFMVDGIFGTSFVEFGSPVHRPGNFPGGLDLAPWGGGEALFFFSSAGLPPLIMKTWIWQSMYLSLFQPVYRELPVLVVSGVIHWYLLNPFLHPFLWSEVFTFTGLGGLPGKCHLIGNISLWGMCCGRVKPLLHCSPWTHAFHALWVLSAKEKMLANWCWDK